MRALYVGELFDRAAAQPYAWAVAPGPGRASLVQEYRQMYQEATRILAERYAASADDPRRGRAGAGAARGARAARSEQ